MSVEEAADHLSAVIEPDNSLHCLGWYLDWRVKDDEAVLDGRFSADDLEAIAVWMRSKS